MLGALVVGLAGCSGPGGDEEGGGARPSPGAGGPGDGGGTADEGASAGDEAARQDLLADVRDLLVLAGSVTGGPAAAVVAAVAEALDEQARSLTTRADSQRPAPPGAPASGEAPDGGGGATGAGGDARGGPGGPAGLVAALGRASERARERVGTVGGPMARLCAALAAGHAVGAGALARAAGVPEPSTLAVAAVDPAGGVGTAVDVAPASPASAAALGRARDVEAQARYAYGVAAVHLAGDPLAVALALRTAHDRAVTAVDAALGSGAGSEDPALRPPRGAWALPVPVVDGGGAATLGAVVEDGCANAWADVVAAAAPDARGAAADAVAVRARQAAQWRYLLGQGATLVALPGLSART